MTAKNTTRRSFLRATAATLAGAVTGSCSRKKGQGEEGAEEPTDVDARLPSPGTKLLRVPEALFRPTSRGCTVHWIPDGPVEARVLAGLVEEKLFLVAEIAANAPPVAVIDQFEPGSEVLVKCQFRRPGEGNWQDRPLTSFRTARLAGESFRVSLLADSHVYFARFVPDCLPNLRKTLARVQSARPDFAIFLGDEAGIQAFYERSGQMNQREALQRWKLWRVLFAPLLSTTPSFLCIGNHEGEAGYYQQHLVDGRLAYYQRWGTIARKRYLLNPLPDTYPEGGEDQGWRGDQNSLATGGAEQGNRSPLENYYAWTWGDGLFVVLDVHRYTNVGGSTPRSVDDWTLGEAQLDWFTEVLRSSGARWKVVIAHHLVGGWSFGFRGRDRNTDYVYGRGGARYAEVGEMKQITSIMREHGAELFLYGHDHVFSHQEAGGIHFVCCGRPTFLQRRQWSSPGWKEAYGDVNRRDPRDFIAAIGYTRLEVSADELRVEYIRTGTDSEGSENVSGGEGELLYSFSLRT